MSEEKPDLLTEQPKKITPPEPAFRKGFLKAAFTQASSAVSSTGVSGAATLPQREMTFRMSADACCPGQFAEDFLITIRALTPVDEEAIASNAMVSSNAALRQKTIALRMMREVNGDPIGPGVDEWLWSALSMTGRAIVLQMCDQLTGGAEAMGKALASISVTTR